MSEKLASRTSPLDGERFRSLASGGIWGVNKQTPEPYSYYSSH
jgi:hypothetical protein